MSNPIPAWHGAVDTFFDDSRRKCPGRELCDLHDWTCFCNVAKCLKRFQELGVSPYEPHPSGFILPSDASLPLYVPMIRHGSRREDLFSSPVVALSTFDLFRQPSKDRSYQPKFTTAEDLRRAFRLRTDAQVLLVSVAKDRKLETYWTNRNAERVPEALSLLGAQCVTIPNYSSFIDAPSVHTRWNLQRMNKAGVELSLAGLAVVPHLNARTSEDWRFWEVFLREQPSMRFVCKEFQTGLHRPEVGMRALGRLDELQYRLKRKLHPILVGGARFTHVAARYFSQFTVIDSVPFMKTVNRRLCVEVDDENLKWEKYPMPAQSALDTLLEYNHAVYARVLQRRVYVTAESAAMDRQLRLPLPSNAH